MNTDLETPVPSALPDARRLIRLPEVKRRTGLQKTRVYELVKLGAFPRPVKLGCSSLWVEDEVQRWIDARIAERDAA